MDIIPQNIATLKKEPRLCFKYSRTKTTKAERDGAIIFCENRQILEIMQICVLRGGVQVMV